MGLKTSPILGCARPGDSEFASTDAAAIERLMTTTRANVARCMADGLRPDIIAASFAALTSELLLGSFDLEGTPPVLAKTDRPLPPPSPSFEFRRCGDYWHFGFGQEKPFNVRHLKGMSDIAQLLKSPGKLIAAMELIGATWAGEKLSGTHDDGLSVDEGRGMRLADAKSVAGIRSYLQELPERISAATERGEIAAVELLRESGEAYQAYLGSTTDKDGRPRWTTGDGDRARVAVKKRITAAIKAIEKHSPEMAMHLDRSIQTGFRVVYEPEMTLPWKF